MVFIFESFPKAWSHNSYKGCPPLQLSLSELRHHLFSLYGWPLQENDQLQRDCLGFIHPNHQHHPQHYPNHHPYQHQHSHLQAYPVLISRLLSFSCSLFESFQEIFSARIYRIFRYCFRPQLRLVPITIAHFIRKGKCEGEVNARLESLDVKQSKKVHLNIFALIDSDLNYFSLSLKQMRMLCNFWIDVLFLFNEPSDQKRKYSQR